MKSISLVDYLTQPVDMENPDENNYDPSYEPNNFIVSCNNSNKIELDYKNPIVLDSNECKNTMITSAGFYYYRQLTERLKNCRITILADQFTYIQLLLIKMDVECERPIEFVQFVDGLFFGDKLWPQRFHDTYRRYT
ncbi:hypothetical protein BLA29_012042, partial [Euroglyphus maynei]